MPAEPLLLRTKLSPPRLHSRVLARPALTDQLREALEHRLTLVQAGTGYGKSTALAALAASDPAIPLAWLSLSESDTDPQQFLAYLVATFRRLLPTLSALPSAVLDEIGSDGTPSAWAQVVDALVNALTDGVSAPTLLVLDDYHVVASAPEIAELTHRFLTYLPPDVHVILSTRYPLTSLNLRAWRAKGEILEIHREALAFQPAEIETLFHETYGLRLSPADVAALAHKTEGWPIALQLAWQGLRHATNPSVVSLLAQGPASLGALFDYLAQEVLERQPAEVQAFLRDTALLRELTPGACDAITATTTGEAMLAHLHESDLFVVALGEKHYRYNLLFHDFIRAQWAADPRGAEDRQRRAAGYFQAQANGDEAIYHWLEARAFSEAALVVEGIGDRVLRAGRVDTVARWLDALPAAVLAERPRLQVFWGDVCRFRSRFDDALAWYGQAERTWQAQNDLAGVSRALRGQALIYLDTVRPAKAAHLLEEALRLTDGMADREARARMLELLAENKLNLGMPGEAEALRAEAQTLRDEGPSEDVVSVRVKLRTGRLAEAQHILEAWAEAERTEAERGQAHPPRSHRETLLILSLIYAFQGDATQAQTLAQAGVALGERMLSPFTTAVAHIRSGHAWQLRPSALASSAQSREEAIRCYQTAIALGDQVAVRRTRAEALWGLTRAYGYGGDLESAERAATEGMDIAQTAGDQWMTALIEQTLGASYVLAGRVTDAVDRLTRTLAAFRECDDRLGRATSRLWLSLAYLDQHQSEHFAACVDDVLALCEAQGYDFLFTHSTLTGVPDPRRLVPVLLDAIAHRRHPAYAAHLLAVLGLPDIRQHPGYQLRVQTLGAFRVWRGEMELDGREWKRDKARQLFQLLLTQRRRPLQREEITEQLWPGLGPEAASRDFKVALNALNKVLEPARLAETPSAYITREGVTYGLRPGADLWLDAAEFERECEAGLRRGISLSDAGAHLQSALGLYSGDYLTEALYEDWASAERERLLTLYLRAADRLAGLLIDNEQWDEGARVCGLILARDACWERAYRLMMVAYARQGNRARALRIYQQCVEALRSELDITPSVLTLALAERLNRGDDLTGLEL